MRHIDLTELTCIFYAYVIHDDAHITHGQILKTYVYTYARPSVSSIWNTNTLVYTRAL